MTSSLSLWLQQNPVTRHRDIHHDSPEPSSLQGHRSSDRPLSPVTRLLQTSHPTRNYDQWGPSLRCAVNPLLSETLVNFRSSLATWATEKIIGHGEWRHSYVRLSTMTATLISPLHLCDSPPATITPLRERASFARGFRLSATLVRSHHDIMLLSHVP